MISTYGKPPKISHENTVRNKSAPQKITGDETSKRDEQQPQKTIAPTQPTVCRNDNRGTLNKPPVVAVLVDNSLHL